MMEKSSSVEADGEMLITVVAEAGFIIEPDESLTRFHLDDLDGCQFSILFVSRLMVVKIKGHT